MSSLEIGECSNNTPRRRNVSSIIQVGYELMMNDEEGVDFSLARIFRVPLRDFCNDHFYSPQLVSIGPFHYGRSELCGMEKHKSEAVRRMQKRIQNKDPNVTIKSIVEVDMVEKDKKIREFYGENISYSPIELAWMVTRDACFIFEFIIHYMKYYTKCVPLYQEMRVSSSKYDPIFDVCSQNPTRNTLMDDILLFENQIPLFVLQHLLEILMGSPDAANKKLDDIMAWLAYSTTRQQIFNWNLICDFHKCCHVLEILYQAMVGAYLNLYAGEARKLFSPAYKRRVPVCFKNGVHWITANFKTSFARCGSRCSNWMTRLLQYPFRTTSDAVEQVAVDMVKLPPTVELINAGMKLHPVLFSDVKGSVLSPAMQWIRFDEKTSTLYLPEVRVTTESESLLRNMIAMEVSSEDRYLPRPMTQFAKLMDELIDSEEDVAVLRKAGVLKNFLGSNQKVAQFFNSLTEDIIHQNWCKPVDDARLGIYNYTKRKYKILWSEFMSAYFSKPWLVAGSIAATLLLLMTVVQVLCLFYNCSP